MTRIRGERGGDGVGAVEAMLKGETLKEATKPYANVWFEESQRHLFEAATNRAGDGAATADDSEGRTGRRKGSLGNIAKSAYPPYWDDADQAWKFGYTHVAAIYHEFGARPHEIRAKNAQFLAFEWPDAPPAVKEQFKHTEGDLVFFKKINHPGVPAIGFVRYGRARAKAAVEQAGWGSVEFETKGGSP